jgi:hypothetical protein
MDGGYAILVLVLLVAGVRGIVHVAGKVSGLVKGSSPMSPLRQSINMASGLRTRVKDNLIGQIGRVLRRGSSRQDVAVWSIGQAWYSEAEAILIEVAGAIIQTDKSVGNKLLDALLAKGVGAMSAASITGLVGALGTASTGTAIGALTGAAATSAKLFWIGSIVGGGAVVGGWMVLGAAIMSGIFGARLWRGKPRPVSDLNEDERAILSAIELLVPALRAEAVKSRAATNEEMNALRSIWGDLEGSVREYMKGASSGRLAPKHRLRLKIAHRKQIKLGRQL